MLPFYICRHFMHAKSVSVEGFLALSCLIPGSLFGNVFSKFGFQQDYTGVTQAHSQVIDSIQKNIRYVDVSNFKFYKMCLSAPPPFLNRIQKC